MDCDRKHWFLMSWKTLRDVALTEWLPPPPFLWKSRWWKIWGLFGATLFLGTEKKIIAWTCFPRATRPHTYSKYPPQSPLNQVLLIVVCKIWAQEMKIYRDCYPFNSVVRWKYYTGKSWLQNVAQMTPKKRNTLLFFFLLLWNIQASALTTVDTDIFILLTQTDSCLYSYFIFIWPQSSELIIRRKHFPLWCCE